MKIRSLIPRALTLLALALPVAAITVLAKRYSAEVSALEHARVEMLRQDARLEMQRSHVRELSRLLGQIALPGVEVSGDTVGEAQQAFAERMSRRRLVFVLSPYCGACTASLPFLDSLETERPGSVLGVAFSITAVEPNDTQTITLSGSRSSSIREVAWLTCFLGTQPQSSSYMTKPGSCQST